MTIEQVVDSIIRIARERGYEGGKPDGRGKLQLQRAPASALAWNGQWTRSMNR
ncbi:MAG: hypothetical protein ACLTW9_00255 [Enterocloster sp.]